MLVSIFLLMAATAVLPLLWPLLRHRDDAPRAVDDPAGVYAAQYAEIGRERATRRAVGDTCPRPNAR